jgi:hypothetical protein
MASLTRSSASLPLRVRGSGPDATRSKAIFVKGDLNRCRSAASTPADSLPFNRAAVSRFWLTFLANGKAAIANNAHAVKIEACQREEVTSRFIPALYRNRRAEVYGAEVHGPPTHY